MYQKIKNNRIYVCFILLTLLFLCYWFVHDQRNVIVADGLFYYQYFVKIFITRDFVGGGLIKYPVGTALVQLPFLLVGLICARIFGIDFEYGQAPIFQFSVFVSAVFYTLLGLTFLYRLLQKRYSNKAATLACVSLLFGTMLLVYTTGMASFSHAYGFFSCTAFFCYTDWYEQKYESLSGKNKLWADMFLGCLLGLVVIIRNTNIIIAFAYLLYGVDSLRGLKTRLKKLFGKKRIYQIVIFLGIYMIQLICYRLQTGNWVLYSYTGEHFTYLLNPQIYKVLFSDAKGLFIYSPILFVALMGMIMDRKKRNAYDLAQWIIFAVQTYIIASWWCWWLGTAYSERMYCDLLCIFAIPLAGFYEQLLLYENEKDILPEQKKRRMMLCVPIWFMILSFILLNLIWIQGCSNGVISSNFGTWKMLSNQLMDKSFLFAIPFCLCFLSMCKKEKQERESVFKKTKK